jgi:hypothetical protein
MPHAAHAGDGPKAWPSHLWLGLYPTIDDVAKLTTPVTKRWSAPGQQILHAAKLAEALYKTTAMGLPSRQENRFGEGCLSSVVLVYLSYPQRLLLPDPHMVGYGGNLVVFLPNGISAFHFADSHNYDMDTMILAGKPSAPSPNAAGFWEASPSVARQPLSAS